LEGLKSTKNAELVDFWEKSKILFFTKTSCLTEFVWLKLEFVTNVSIFDEIFDFWPIFDSAPSFRFFAEIFQFENLLFCQKIYISQKMWSKLEKFLPVFSVSFNHFRFTFSSKISIYLKSPRILKNAFWPRPGSFWKKNFWCQKISLHAVITKR